MIMQETGKDFSDAADLLWELEGRPEWYKQEKKKKNPVPDFRISREEAEQIGIHFPGRLLAPVGIDFGKNELPSGYEYDKKIIEPGAQEQMTIRMEQIIQMLYMEQSAIISTWQMIRLRNTF